MLSAVLAQAALHASSSSAPAAERAAAGAAAGRTLLAITSGVSVKLMRLASFSADLLILELPSCMITATALHVVCWWRCLLQQQQQHEWRHDSSVDDGSVESTARRGRTCSLAAQRTRAATRRTA